MRPACPSMALGSQRSAPRGPSWDIFPLPCHLLEPSGLQQALHQPTAFSAISLTESRRNWTSGSSWRADVQQGLGRVGRASPAAVLCTSLERLAQLPHLASQALEVVLRREKERLGLCRAQQECAKTQPPLRLWPPAGPPEDRCALTCPKKRKGSRNVRPRHIQDWKPSAEDEGLLRARSLRGRVEPSSRAQGQGGSVAVSLTEAPKAHTASPRALVRAGRTQAGFRSPGVSGDSGGSSSHGTTLPASSLGCRGRRLDCC